MTVGANMLAVGANMLAVGANMLAVGADTLTVGADTLTVGVDTPQDKRTAGSVSSAVSAFAASAEPCSSRAGVARASFKPMPFCAGGA